MHRDRVEVALHDDRRPFLSDGRARGVERVECPALIEEVRLRRVDVLPALVRPHRPAAKGDDPAPAVLDRHHEAVTKAIPEPPFGLAGEAGRDRLLLAIPLPHQVRKKAVAKVRRVAKPEALDGVRTDASALEVPGDLSAALGPPQRLTEVEEGGVVGRKQALLALLSSRVAPRGQLNARAVRQDPEGLHRLQAVLLLEPGENIPALPTSKAVVCPAIRVHLKGRRLLRVKWAEPPEHAAGLPQGHSLGDELHDVDAFLDEIEITGHPSKYRAGLAGAPC